MRQLNKLSHDIFIIKSGKIEYTRVYTTKYYTVRKVWKQHYNIVQKETMMKAFSFHKSVCVYTYVQE